MKKWALLMLVISLLSLVGCNGEEDKSMEYKSVEYTMISAKEAKEIMDTTDEDYIILDVRTEEEYSQGHIPGAVLIPDYEISERAEKELTNKEQMILVYCRSGNRSKKASKILADLGYSNIKEFGGIIDWPYEVEE